MFGLNTSGILLKRHSSATGEKEKRGGLHDWHKGKEKLWGVMRRKKLSVVNERSDE